MSYNLFYPEIFFLIVILFILIFNILLRYNTNFFFYLDVFNQILFSLIVLLFLLLNIEFDSYSYSFIFLIDQHTCLIKIYFVLISIFAFFSIYNSSLIQKLSFFSFFSTANPIFEWCSFNTISLSRARKSLTISLLILIGFFVNLDVITSILKEQPYFVCLITFVLLFFLISMYFSISLFLHLLKLYVKNNKTKTKTKEDLIFSFCFFYILIIILFLIVNLNIIEIETSTLYYNTYKTSNKIDFNFVLYVYIKPLIFFLAYILLYCYLYYT